MTIPALQFGRVESDPMGVPVATTMKRPGDDSFDRLLRDATARDAKPQSSAPAAEEPAPEVVAPPAATGEQTTPSAREPRADVGVDEQPATDTGSNANPTDVAAVDTDVTTSTRRGEPARQNAPAGKGTDSPRAFHSAAEPLIAATLQAQPVTPTAPGAVQATPKITTTPGEPLIRAIGRSEATDTAASRASRAQAGYATRNAANAQLLEQARDSVFKQILMKLNADGGEVRMRLEPPDLGELDLLMTVEGGNKLRLSIAAERPDLAQLLQRHLDELKQSLQQNGLEVTGAEVQTRGDSGRGSYGAGSNGERDGEQHEDARPQGQARGTQGYITAEGLDYWV